MLWKYLINLIIQLYIPNISFANWLGFDTNHSNIQFFVRTMIMMYYYSGDIIWSPQKRAEENKKNEWQGDAIGFSFSIFLINYFTTFEWVFYIEKKIDKKVALFYK